MLTGNCLRLLMTHLKQQVELSAQTNTTNFGVQNRSMTKAIRICSIIKTLHDPGFESSARWRNRNKPQSKVRTPVSVY